MPISQLQIAISRSLLRIRAFRHAIYKHRNTPLGGVILGLLRNRITWNRWYSCSFWSYSVVTINGISFDSVRSAPDHRMNGIRFTQNGQNTAEYAFFWKTFGGKSNAAARAGRLVSGWKT